MAEKYPDAREMDKKELYELVDRLEFSNWQIHKIRRALYLFKLKHQKRGNTITWAAVLYRLYSRENGEAFDEMRKQYERDGFDDETLRKFAKGETDAEGFRRVHMAWFMLRDGILKIKHLDRSRDDLDEIIAVYGYLGNSVKDEEKYVDKNIKALPGDYFLNRGDNTVESISLTLVPDVSKKFLRVDEEYDISKRKPCSEGGSKLFSVSRTIRYGFGITLSAGDAFQIFLFDYKRNSNISYIHINGVQPSGKKDFFFMRVGGEPCDTPSHMTDIQGPRVILHNIYKFERKHVFGSSSDGK